MSGADEVQLSIADAHYYIWDLALKARLPIQIETLIVRLKLSWASPSGTPGLGAYSSGGPSI